MFLSCYLTQTCKPINLSFKCQLPSGGRLQYCLNFALHLCFCIKVGVSDFLKPSNYWDCFQHWFVLADMGRMGGDPITPLHTPPLTVQTLSVTGDGWLLSEYYLHSGIWVCNVVTYRTCGSLPPFYMILWNISIDSILKNEAAFKGGEQVQPEVPWT